MSPNWSNITLYIKSSSNIAPVSSYGTTSIHDDGTWKLKLWLYGVIKFTASSRLHNVVDLEFFKMLILFRICAGSHLPGTIVCYFTSSVQYKHNNLHKIIEIDEGGCWIVMLKYCVQTGTCENLSTNVSKYTFQGTRTQTQNYLIFKPSYNSCLFMPSKA